VARTSIETISRKLDDLHDRLSDQDKQIALIRLTQTNHMHHHEMAERQFRWVVGLVWPVLMAVIIFIMNKLF